MQILETNLALQNFWDELDRHHTATLVLDYTELWRPSQKTASRRFRIRA